MSARFRITAARRGRTTSRRATRDPRRVARCAPTVVAAFVVALVVLPVLPAAANERGDQTDLPAAYQHLSLPQGESSVNVCSYAEAAGTAHCNAELRTDALGRDLRPNRPGHSSQVSPSTSLGDDGAYSPAYLQSAYNIASADAAAHGGVGQVVGIVDADDDPSLLDNVNYYRTFFGLAPCATTTVSTTATGCVMEKVNEYGQAAPLPASNVSWGVETSLDVEMVSAICPNCQILIVEASSASIADLGTAVNTAVSLGANVVSNSYGSSEYPNENSDALAYFNHPGVPIVVASGDSGFGVQFPAASPTVVAVGGTTLIQNSNNGTRSGTETVWSGAGAGCSSYEPKPSWQHDTGCATRTVADVAAVANPSTGVWVYDTFGKAGFAIYGGTSVATPIISSMFALASNPTDTSFAPASFLYAGSSDLFHVTSGTDGGCGTYLCNAADSQSGYNGPTGLGTPGGSPNSVSAFTAPSTTQSVATVPGPPTLSVATSGVNTLTFTFTAPTSDGGSALTGFDLFSATTPGAESDVPIATTSADVPSVTVSSLVGGTTYYFVATALNAVGASEHSGELSATPVAATVTGPPTLRTTTVGNQQVTLAWTAPTNGSQPVTGYSLFMGSSPGGESSVPVNATPFESTSVTIAALTNGETYYFTVAARNVAGTSAPSNEVAATPLTRPGVPRRLAAKPATHKGVVVSWSVPGSDGGTPTRSFQILRSTTPGLESKLATYRCGGPTCSYVDANTRSGVSYFYEVVAINAVGAGSRSNQVSAKAT